MEKQLFLGWQDDSKKPLVAKIADGLAAYERRFGVAATLVWVAQDAPATLEVPGVVVERRSGMQVSVVFVGRLKLYDEVIAEGIIND